MNPKIRITGSKRLISQFKQFGKEAEKDLSTVAMSSAGQMRDMAQATKTSYSMTIQGFIGDIVVYPNVEGAKVYEVSVTNLPESAYVEFGTGAKVQIPTGWQDVAQQFFVNGKGTLPPYPYFIPAFNRVKAVYQTELKQVLNALIKKYNASTR